MMTESAPKLTFDVAAKRMDAHDSDESDARLALLHGNVKKYGTVFNTVSPGTSLGGVVRRGELA